MTEKTHKHFERGRSLGEYVSAEAIRRLISEVLSDKKLNKSSNFDRERTYKDEPIIATANRISGYVPSRIIEMRKLADTLNMSMEEIFYRQAQFMSDYTDDCPYHGEIVRYFPTYYNMNDAQLRGYFTWRTKLRTGIVEPAPLSFAFLHIYELLMLVGLNAPTEGYKRLNELSASFSELFPQTIPYLEQWKKDFVVYYGLDRELYVDSSKDEQLITLLHFRERSESEVFSAACALSSYNAELSKFCEKYRADMEKAFYRVFCALSDYFEKNRKKGIIERIFGTRISCIYPMFSKAVFYSGTKHEDCEYSVNEIHSYTCRSGIWSCRKYYGIGSRSRELGAFMKTAESLLRAEFDYRPLKPEIKAKGILAVIKKETERYAAEKKRSEKPVITLDLSSLGEIRRSADLTRDKLIIDEEEYEAVCDEVSVKPHTETAEENMLGLSGAEADFLHALLFGEPYTEILHKNATTALLLSDGINEKLFDIFGDTVIDFTGDVPELVEDYIEELKERITK